MQGIQVIGSGSLATYFSFDGSDVPWRALNYDIEDGYGLGWDGESVLPNSIYGEYQLKFSIDNDRERAELYQTITIKDSAPTFATEIGNFTLQVTADGAASGYF